MSQNLFEGDFERELIVAVRCVAINRIRRIIEKYFEFFECKTRGLKVGHMMAVYKTENLISLCFDHKPQNDSIFDLSLIGYQES